MDKLSDKFFFLSDPSLTAIYPLSLHDALPICADRVADDGAGEARAARVVHAHHVACADAARFRDRKSTRLNSSHMSISYAVFCLKKKTVGIIHSTHEFRVR